MGVKRKDIFDQIILQFRVLIGPTLLSGMCRNEAKACSILLVDKRFTAPEYRRFLLLRELKSITIRNRRAVCPQMTTYGCHIFNRFVSMIYGISLDFTFPDLRESEGIVKLLGIFSI